MKLNKVTKQIPSIKLTVISIMNDLGEALRKVLFLTVSINLWWSDIPISMAEVVPIS